MKLSLHQTLCASAPAPPANASPAHNVGSPFAYALTYCSPDATVVVPASYRSSLSSKRRFLSCVNATSTEASASWRSPRRCGTQVRASQASHPPPAHTSPQPRHSLFSFRSPHPFHFTRTPPKPPTTHLAHPTPYPPYPSQPCPTHIGTLKYFRDVLQGTVSFDKNSVDLNALCPAFSEPAVGCCGTTFADVSRAVLAMSCHPEAAAGVQDVFESAHTLGCKCSRKCSH